MTQAARVQIQPGYLRLGDASRYCSVSAQTFLEWVDQKKMPEGFYPSGKGNNRVRLWDRRDIDDAMQAIKDAESEGDGDNEWDALLEVS